MATRHRSAVSGQYISEEKAKRNPRESVRETDKKPPSGGKGAKGKK
ncbi:multidrug transporter [Pseudomonas fluorescens]|uniref:Multidrug transporter n=1 Tax=Pseudomonas fluorescens TaxID=294 RepID=A0A423P4B0_PSEFL|nr:multidrug transporter [Pseudomonas fluorescens]